MTGSFYSDRDARPLAHRLEQPSGARLPALANVIREDQRAVVQGSTAPFNSCSGGRGRRRLLRPQ
ncbi:hypothetical protein [Streptomyces sp. M92]|uniref:hypothetical protein n=1 Tax=Streptomyces sp. M92 TaxID=2944250 RepID=UPI00234A8E74|nr:hypothetical protein [Streptomyces sp. M92]WCN05193.1 hypothetical protein M6G08_25515 [Streptomyces sp. M92]